MSNDTRRTARPTLSENITLFVSSLQNCQTLKTKLLHSVLTSPAFVRAGYYCKIWNTFHSSSIHSFDPSIQ
ncbi:hypothetical protein ACJIZ3_001934 [Penstemon smallii]|uniref:Uncharacterized protein n=1 Tax=Penstemon smallii TaxID=265156 RepID=A0ABD3U6U4_9LAMI